MTHASLFSGIGGAEIAAVWMGWQNLFHCEIEEFPRRVLDYWFPNAESYEDIRKTNFKKWGGVKSMFLQEDSLASLSALQVEERERKIIATSGKKCIEQSKKSTPLGLLVKMLLESQQWWSQAKQLTWVVKPIYSTRVTYIEKKVFSHSSEFVKTSKTLDMKSNRLLYQLVPSGHHIDETGCGLLPTVQTQGLKKCNNKTGRTEFYPLSLLPTPTALDKGGGRMNRSLSVNSSDRPTLALAAQMKLLPTPNASEGVKYTTTYNQHSQMGRSLTAMAINGMLGTKIDHKKDGIPFHLNPLYVADMMGYPSMWTVLPFLSQNGDKSQ